MTAATAVRILRLDERWTRRARARILLLDLRSDDPERALAAEQRFRILPGYSELPLGRLLGWRFDIGLRHALAVVRAEELL